MTESTPIYALLIGIDHYKPNRLYKSLKGAVRDINLVETFLQQTRKIPPERIYKLISPNQEDTALMDARAAQQEPTYENIVNAFQQITETAQPGEQVYIHYSGHGGRATSIYPFKQEPNDEGIVPMDIGDTEEGRYLRDVEMTTLLKRMTDKGLIVTMVLDSCHSGGAMRGDLDAEIRSAGQTDRAQRSAASLVADPEELQQNWLDLTRNHAIGAAGLPQSRDYVLLAACRPNEYAYEYAVNGGTQRNGALTYWMVDTLTSVATTGQPLTYKLLHDRVNAQVQSKFPQQTPMIVGESDRLVFGSSTWSTPFTVTVINVVSDSQITLNAGQAQGLSRGTRFSIYPLNTTDFTDKQKQVAIVELIQVKGSESVARVLKPEEGGIEAKAIERGAPAVMISAPISLIQRVRFFGEKAAGEQEGDLPAALVGQQASAVEAVRQALAGNGWVVEVQEGESALYQVAIDREGHYEICQNGRPIPNLRPLLPITDATAARRVVDRLIHLAKFQAVQSLDNSSSNLAQAIEVALVKQDDSAFADPLNPTMQNGEIVCLRLTNKGNQPLKVAVLDLESSTWEISQIPLGGQESPFFNLDAGATQETLLSMTIPEGQAYQQTRETLKVFAVQKGLADFRWLTLPSLDEPPQSRDAELENILDETVQNEVTRSLGEPEGINPLNNLLKLIGADLDKTPNVPRVATVVVDPKQEWVTKEIRITVER